MDTTKISKFLNTFKSDLSKTHKQAVHISAIDASCLYRLAQRSDSGILGADDSTLVSIPKSELIEVIREVEKRMPQIRRDNFRLVA